MTDVGNRIRLPTSSRTGLRRSALFTPISGDEAEKESYKMVRYTAWLYFDGGKAKVSPDTLGIPRL